jgi:hypothetical protein
MRDGNLYLVALEGTDTALAQLTNIVVPEATQAQGRVAQVREVAELAEDAEPVVETQGRRRRSHGNRGTAPAS